MTTLGKAGNAFGVDRFAARAAHRRRRFVLQRAVLHRAGRADQRPGLVRFHSRLRLDRLLPEPLHSLLFGLLLLDALFRVVSSCLGDHALRRVDVDVHGHDDVGRDVRERVLDPPLVELRRFPQQGQRFAAEGIVLRVGRVGFALCAGRIR